MDAVASSLAIAARLQDVPSATGWAMARTKAERESPRGEQNIAVVDVEAHLNEPAPPTGVIASPATAVVFVS